MITQNNVHYYLHWFSQAFYITEKDSFDFSSSLAFDFSVTTTLVPLVCGARVVIYPHKKEQNVKAYLEYLAHKKITFIKQVPVIFH